MFNYAVVPYVLPGKYVCYAFSYTGGALIQWCTDTLAKKEKELAEAQGISVNEFLEQLINPRTMPSCILNFARSLTLRSEIGR